MAQFIVDIIAEDVQKEHIAQKMHPVAVEKGVGNKLMQVRPLGIEHPMEERIFRSRLGEKAGRYHEDQYVGYNQGVIHQRGAPQRIVGANGNNHFIGLS